MVVCGHSERSTPVVRGPAAAGGPPPTYITTDAFARDFYTRTLLAKKQSGIEWNNPYWEIRTVETVLNVWDLSAVSRTAAAATSMWTNERQFTRLKDFTTFSFALNKRGLVEYVCMTSSVSNAVARVGRRPVTALMFLINDSRHIL